tara:strand:+ start:14 stop:277 length:264 start_codon:yes stop_codon:yes gene_type:complete
MLKQILEIFTFLVKMLYKTIEKTRKVIMGLISKGKRKTTEDLDLTAAELNILLQLIKNSTFSGDTIEVLYNLIIKLQKKYDLNKDKE